MDELHPKVAKGTLMQLDGLAFSSLSWVAKIVTCHGTLVISVNLNLLAVDLEAHRAHPGSIVCVLSAAKRGNLVWPLHKKGVYLMFLHHKRT